MLTEAEEAAAVRVDPSAPAVLIGDQLRVKSWGEAQARSLRALLMPEV